jgi:hypothetical protein
VIVTGDFQVFFCSCPEVVFQGNFGGYLNHIEQSIGGLLKFTLNITLNSQPDEKEDA